MIKKLIMLLAVFFLVVSFAQAAEVGGVAMPDKMTVGEENLVLNGIGIREKFFVAIDVYAAGLYLKNKTTDAQAIIAADETMSIKIQIMTGMLNSEKFQKATLTGFQEATNGNTKPIQKEIDLFMSAFSEEISKGDVFDIQYVKGVGAHVFKNGRTEPEVVVPGLPAKQALFAIWLGPRKDKHLQNLAKDLLGVGGK